MKKITLSIMIIVLSLAIIPTTMLAKTTSLTADSNASKEMPAEVKILFDRLEEIKEMDKSDLSSSDKKVLRKEVKAIKANLRSSGNGVYLSVGAIILIVILLIILL